MMTLRARECVIPSRVMVVRTECGQGSGNDALGAVAAAAVHVNEDVGDVFGEVEGDGV